MVTITYGMTSGMINITGDDYTNSGGAELLVGGLIFPCSFSQMC